MQKELPSPRAYNSNTARSYIALVYHCLGDISPRQCQCDHGAYSTIRARFLTDSVHTFNEYIMDMCTINNELGVLAMRGLSLRGYVREGFYS